jgi:hypothetical protein
MSKGTEPDISPKKIYKWQINTWERLDIIIYKENASQNHNEIDFIPMKMVRFGKFANKCWQGCGEI